MPFAQVQVFQGDEWLSWDGMVGLSAALSDPIAISSIADPVSVQNTEADPLNVRQQQNWVEFNNPGISLQATITRAAVVGQRHVITSINAALIAPAAQGNVFLRLLDGVTSIWNTRMILPAGTQDRVVWNNLNIVCTAGNAVTLDFSAAPAVGNYQMVSITGYTTV